MRWVIAIFLFGCSHPAPATVSLAAPAPLPQIALTTREDPAPPNAVRIDASRDSDWARAFPRANDFEEIEIPATRTLLVFWRIGRSRAHRALPPDEDYAGNHAAPVDLVIGARTIAFGDLPGSPSPLSQSYCARLGWRAQPDTPIRPPRHVVSAMSLGTMQGDSEMMIVGDGPILHVLHRETSDGHCDAAKQGPLDICEGFEWERRADIHVEGNPALFERIDDEKKPFDCGTAEIDGSKLIAPK